MKAKNYLILCAIVCIAVVLSVLYVPGVGDLFEIGLLMFLSIASRT